MRFTDAADFRSALDRRLEELAGDNEEWLARDRKCIAFSRMLARFAVIAPDCWSLAGGFALDCRSLRPRTARELEIEWRVDRWEEYRSAPLAAAACDVGDLFEYEVTAAGGCVTAKDVWRRFDVDVFLAEELFENFSLKLDLRFGRVGMETVRVEDMLDFAGLDPVEIEAMALEAQLANSLHSYTRSVDRDSGPPSSQILLDMKLISELPAVDAMNLNLCILGIFRKYDAPIPESLPYPLEEWAEWYHRIAESVGAPPELDDGYREAAALFDPILRGDVLTGTWSPEERRWL